ncbi:MAG: riboflavin synthase [Rhodospirillaceae bacterium]|nr:riboflavin synthase [Rhodospirillaceae bacterium]|tara:strand:- start:704 stop:1351 length:648 start_codon:yes stop_codon:yes gene_type:complete
MFSGIIKGVGKIIECSDVGDDRRLNIEHKGLDMSFLNPGDSVAVNGACLTVVESKAEYFTVDVSIETLTKTTLGDWQLGNAVNLENALRLGDSLDGHFVTGHVDGVGHIESLSESGRSTVLRIRTNEKVAPFLAQKGSVAVDGVSLTVNEVENSLFHVNIIPHTRENTVIDGYALGTAVNIEVDLIARYLERLYRYENNTKGIDINLLKKYGYTS